MQVFWKNMSYTTLKEYSKANAIVLIPVGSIEQHGPHLPVGTDSIIATEIARLTAIKLNSQKQRCIVAPSVEIANSAHHMHFCGSMTLKPTEFFEVLRTEIRNIVTNGFERIAIINGHGGNVAPINVALIMINEEFGFPIYNAGYWTGARELMKKVLTAQEGMIHACEAETSMMLSIDERLVDPIYRILPKVEEKSSGVKAFSSGKVSTFHFIEEETDSGYLGVPSAATAQTGKTLLDGMSSIVAEALIEECLWQHRP